jgi:DNA-binding transcriptional regulator YdaS (Cro superfamily)
MRAEGRSIKEIERLLGVARSSVSRWVKDVQLGDAQRHALAARVTEGRLQAAQRKAHAARLLRAEDQREGRRLAQELDGLYVAGCMLYWAEGEKNRCRLSVSNSDVELLCIFVDFLRKHFDVSSAAMRIHCHLFADHIARQREIEQFWLNALGLPAASLGKSVVNTYSKYSQKKRRNKLPYGTCKLTVNSTKIVQTIFGSIPGVRRVRAPRVARLDRIRTCALR